VSVEALRQALGDKVLVDEPMARHTTIRVGGPADLFARASTLTELSYLVGLAGQHEVPFFILGHGSNILVADQGIRGLVIANVAQGYELGENGSTGLAADSALLYAESGASLPSLAYLMARQGWAGLEWAIGIPGSVGGAVVNNVGAHDGCLADVLRRVSVLDQAGEIRQLAVGELGLGYRTSRFKVAGGSGATSGGSTSPGRAEIILSAEFVLHRDSASRLIALMQEYTAQRRRTQPTEPGVGSIFKNPPGDYAGRLIEQAGLKGTCIGDAMISPVHANFFVNVGRTRAAEVWALIELARARVREKFGVELELEIELVGE
jgi:UDP-N-acetylmuramate dehydrogenase